jgi:16S rRNA (guanine527-N7)-methyltransferase
MFHVKHEGWPSVAARLGVDLPSGAEERLTVYEDLLRNRGAAMGLVAAGDVETIRERHVADGVRAAPLLARGAVVADLGSGSGIPGIPVAITRPDTDVTLVEARRSRVAFLELAIETTGVPNARVVLARAEDLERGFDVCLARAFAPLPEAWRVADGLLRTGGALLYWAGSRWDPATTVPGTTIRVMDTPRTDPSTSTLAGAGPVAIMTRQ